MHAAHGGRPFWKSVFVSTTHRAAGCVIGAAFASGGVFAGKIVDTCPDTWWGVLMHSADIRPFRVGLADVKFSPEGEFWAGGEGWIRVRTAPPAFFCPGMGKLGKFGHDQIWTSCLLSRRRQARHGHLAVGHVMVDALGGQTLAGPI